MRCSPPSSANQRISHSLVNSLLVQNGAQNKSPTSKEPGMFLRGIDQPHTRCISQSHITVQV